MDMVPPPDHPPNTHPLPNPQTPTKRRPDVESPARTPQTPRKRKVTTGHRLLGVKSRLAPNLSLEEIPKRLVDLLKLPYTPDAWQGHLICRILQGYDIIFCAGTGYGKSLIFEGLAVLGGPGKLVMVIGCEFSVFVKYSSRFQEVLYAFQCQGFQPYLKVFASNETVAFFLDDFMDIWFNH